jgi:hypothetical protein
MLKAISMASFRRSSSTHFGLLAGWSILDDFAWMASFSFSTRVFQDVASVARRASADLKVIPVEASMRTKH